MYISLAISFDHCTQGNTGDSGDTPPSLGRCSIINKADMISSSTASSKLRDAGGEGVVVLKVVHKVGDLGCLHVVAAAVEAIVGGEEGA